MTPGISEGDSTAVRLGRAIVNRMQERAFWAIQAGVLTISALHVAFEAELIPLGAWGPIPAAHHIPVILYLAPVAYAGLVYGTEGGVMTGLWAGFLASINVVIWSLDNYEWVLELVFVVVVVGMGVVMALPVERERKQSRRAEIAAQRLETLNELATAAIPARTPAQAARSVLAELVDLTEFDDAAIVLWRRDQPNPVIQTTHGSPSDLAQILESRQADRKPARQAQSEVHARPIETPIDTENMTGSLFVVSSRNGHVDPEVTDFLATVGNQLAVRVENAMLVEQEQAMLSTYVKLVTEAQEEERRRLARELHDGPAQQLAMLVRSLEDPDGGWGASGALRESAAGILGELRRVARDQRPTLLDDLGLVPALEWLLSETNNTADLATQLTVEGDTRRLEAATEVVLYRIAQEALRNAERHAEAGRVDVLISFSPDNVSLVISDDGHGFSAPRSPGEYLRAGRLGLMGMHERTQLVGASLDIKSSPSSGTAVSVTVPT